MSERGRVVVRDLGIGKVLGGVEFALEPGGCLGVIGVNGAGKSTLCALLAGVLPSKKGRIQGLGPTAYLPEGCPLDATIRVRDWLRMGATLPDWDPQAAEQLRADFELPQKSFAGRLSQGQRVRLGLILTLARRAPFYVLDDPFLGLDPVALVNAERWIAERSADAGMVIAAQHAQALERLCTHLLLLNRGRQVWFAPVDDWRRRFKALRVRGIDGPVGDTAEGALWTTTRGGLLHLLLDDLDGSAEAKLVAAGGDVERMPLSIEELIEAVAGRDDRKGARSSG